MLFCVVLFCAVQMLVQPLDRIFYSIRTNAAQVVAALGAPEVRSLCVCMLGWDTGGAPSAWQAASSRRLVLLSGCGQSLFGFHA
jgi:hypothetical protein